ncbi:MBL fold metallo-hydrolase [Marinomonas mediterranea]|jgi:Predicted Zn-dependent hydrolases of the beta-lactamase fold|uniref:Zn-dependent hydrolase of the beta-lactamase fold n=1 Tax=Marinomonas mediterranea (strain ATCC 700492 / JCM 21426 / NBRC 103028 / MMB-1) TaxID=717774 RepID=F2JTU7_MARM1|nr:MBL fold metallo-hydrolase [Marinomonas mediterranea]ADZ92717.1 Zn-dependent hydrolase of the beta-lactamase fold [Marinomonas mediterranea MMB-1]WCN18746.1 hydrolase [Marinomonas mediterranea MMB-1]
MKVAKFFGLAITLLVIVGFAINWSISSDVPDMNDVKTDHYADGKFKNTQSIQSKPLREELTLWKELLTEKKVGTKPDIEIPVYNITQEDLNALSDDTIHIVKLGHSSILLKVYGDYWLLDPVFSERASPFQFMGPKRFHHPPIKLDDLPNIELVLISHNHYDHLDKASIKSLAQKTEHFYVPLGVDGDLLKWGVDSKKVKAFDWWQEQEVTNGMVAFTPTQHFSGRGLSDRNKTLWGSWVIKTQEHSLYFSGDSGYFAGFKEIGDKYGPFDLTMVETGAYDDRWADIHMRPEESVQAHIDLQGDVMMPIHNCTFDLAFHEWRDPMNRVVAEGKRRSIKVTAPEFGQIFSISDNTFDSQWWRNEANADN